MTTFLTAGADLLIFVLLPWLIWRLLGRSIPLAVLPILLGLGIAALGLLPAGSPIPSQAGHMLGFIGVLLLAFSAGMEIHRPADAADGETSITTRVSWGRLVGSACTALAVPFAVGSVVAYACYIRLPGWVPPRGDGWLAAMAIGLCLAVSALPVLVGIVRELPRADRSLGQIALRVAVIDDAALWIGIAILIFLANGQSQWLGWAAPEWAAIALLSVLVAGGVVARRLPPPPPWLIWLALPLYLAAGSWASSRLGLHALLGAYFAGAMLAPGWIKRLPVEQIGLFALFGLAPIFFGHSGLRIQNDALSWAALLASIGLVLIALVTKLAAVLLNPPVLRLSMRDKLALGSLLQCKGLMEIVAATILVDQGLLSERGYAALITLAVLSTTITGPLFRWLRGGSAVTSSRKSATG